MYFPDFTEHCPYCGNQIIRPAYTGQKMHRCGICGRTVHTKMKLKLEKTKPIFRSKGEAALIIVSIIVLLLFIVAVDAGNAVRYS